MDRIGRRVRWSGWMLAVTVALLLACSAGRAQDAAKPPAVSEGDAKATAPAGAEAKPPADCTRGRGSETASGFEGRREGDGARGRG